MPTALVTGASAGIGADFCRHLLKLDWKVIMVARSKDKMEKIANEFNNKRLNNILIIVADLCKEKDCKIVCNKSRDYCNNKLDLLVNNAGAGKFNTFTNNCTIEQWNKSLMLNLTSVFIITKYMLNSLENGNGSIVNIGSISAIKPFTTMTPYCVAKAGLAHLTRLNALEFADKKIRVNCIQPATVVTNWHKSAGLNNKQVKIYYQNAKLSHPIGRPGNTKDIINMIMFLADNNKSGWITGQCITMDGGRSLLSNLPKSKL